MPYSSIMIRLLSRLIRLAQGCRAGGGAQARQVGRWMNLLGHRPAQGERKAPWAWIPRRKGRQWAREGAERRPHKLGPPRGQSRLREGSAMRAETILQSD